MITVKYSDEQAQLVATLLNNHKNNNQKIADLAGDALDGIIAASKKEALSDGEKETDNEERPA